MCRGKAAKSLKASKLDHTDCYQALRLEKNVNQSIPRCSLLFSGDWGCGFDLARMPSRRLFGSPWRALIAAVYT